MSSFYNEYILAGVPRVSGGEKKEERSPTEFTDVLTEGQHYLGISMLVYMYSHLCETSRMGLTKLKMEDIKVSTSRSQCDSRYFNYLARARSAAAIIRVVVDELEHEDERV